MEKGDIVEVVPLRKTNSGWYICPVPVVLSSRDIYINGDTFENSKYEIGDEVVVKFDRITHNALSWTICDRDVDFDYSVSDFGKRVYEKKIERFEHVPQHYSNRKNVDSSSISHNQREHTVEQTPTKTSGHANHSASSKNGTNTQDSAAEKFESASVDIDDLRSRAEEAAVQEVPTGSVIRRLPILRTGPGDDPRQRSRRDRLGELRPRNQCSKLGRR